MRKSHVKVCVMPEVIRQSNLELVMDMFDFPADRLLREDRCDEALGESIETFIKTFVQDVEVEVCGCHGRVSIPRTTISLKELLPLIWLWILLRTLEEHVLEELGGSLVLFRIHQTSNLYLDRCCTFISLWVRD